MLSAVSGSDISINRFIAAVGGSRVTFAGRVVAGERAAAAGAPERSAPAEPAGKYTLSDEERLLLEELKQRDAEVRQHEQAHKAAAGRYAAGPATYAYETGPDGRRYAVEGEISIDASEVPGEPEATIRKMRQVQRAALAPAEPSPQDRAVASQAATTEQQARAELARESGSPPEASESAPEDAAPGEGPESGADPNSDAVATARPLSGGAAAYARDADPNHAIAPGRFIDALV